MASQVRIFSASNDGTAFTRIDSGGDRLRCRANSTQTQTVASAVAHMVADGTNTVAAANATDQTTANTLLNELKVDFNAHRSQAGCHQSSQAAIATADASSLATSITLANALKAWYNAHVLNGSGYHGGMQEAPVTTADATDLATVQTLANALKTAYGTHRALVDNSVNYVIPASTELEVNGGVVFIKLSASGTISAMVG